MRTTSHHIPPPSTPVPNVLHLRDVVVKQQLRGVVLLPPENRPETSWVRSVGNEEAAPWRQNRVLFTLHWWCFQ